MMRDQTVSNANPKESMTGEPPKETTACRRRWARRVDVVIHGVTLNGPTTHEADAKESDVAWTLIVYVETRH